MDWLKGGDRNVAFFKAKATRRNDKKYIDLICKEDGTEICESAQIMEAFVNYFDTIFTSYDQNDNHNWNGILKAVKPKGSEEMYNRLLEQYTMEDIIIALFQMNPDKSPGIYGWFFSPLLPEVKGDH